MSKAKAEPIKSLAFICQFCGLNFKSDGLKLGTLFKFDDIIAHYFCVMLSSGLVQHGADKEGIQGYLPKDIMKEWKRGSSLRCCYCKKLRATVGCSVESCRKTFHAPCVILSGGCSQFFGTFDSFCEHHRPRQAVPSSAWQKKVRNDNGMEFVKSKMRKCPICMKIMVLRPSTDLIWGPCCSSWFHRECLSTMADTAGRHHLRCPLCNAEETFTRELLRLGIYIPDQDAKWEMENAFREMYECVQSCSADLCFNDPSGQFKERRKENVADTCLEIITCDVCGSNGVHVQCGNINPDTVEWRCSVCLLGLLKTEQGNQTKTAPPADDEVPCSSSSLAIDQILPEKRVESKPDSLIDASDKSGDEHDKAGPETSNVGEKKEDERAKDLRCSVCQFECPTMVALRRHKFLHDAKRPFQCDVCQYRFFKQEHLRLHEREHTGLKPFTCAQCPAVFAALSSLVLHKAKHDPARRYVCPQCSLRFRTTTTLAAHMDNLHPGSKANGHRPKKAMGDINKNLIYLDSSLTLSDMELSSSGESMFENVGAGGGSSHEIGGQTTGNSIARAGSCSNTRKIGEAIIRAGRGRPRKNDGDRDDRPLKKKKRPQSRNVATVRKAISEYYVPFVTTDGRETEEIVDLPKDDPLNQ